MSVPPAPITRDHACQTGRHPLSEHGLDFYETPRVAVEALLAVEKLSRTVWEPAAGGGAIVQMLRDHGHKVIASDILHQGFDLEFVGDFSKRLRHPRLHGRHHQSTFLGCESLRDASSRLGWTAGVKRHPLRLVLPETRAQGGRHHQPHLKEVLKCAQGARR